MPYFQFDVYVHYHTDPIFAESEEEAKAIANEELQYCGEEYDTTFKLYDIEFDTDEEEEEWKKKNK